MVEISNSSAGLIWLIVRRSIENRFQIGAKYSTVVMSYENFKRSPRFRLKND